MPVGMCPGGWNQSQYDRGDDSGGGGTRRRNEYAALPLSVLQGPEGVRKVVKGDTVPGVGRIDSVVRWGSRWIVTTSSGLIATP